jgi:general secretion pathway protein E
MKSNRIIESLQSSSAKALTPAPIRQLRPDLVPTFLDELMGFESLAELRQSGDHQANFAQALIRDAVQCGASDVHYQPFQDGARIRLRIDGWVWDVAQLPPAQARVVLNQFKTMGELDPVLRFTPRDAHAVVKTPSTNVDLRLALAPSPSGETLAIRLLDPRRLERSISELGLTEANLARLKAWMEGVNGMFLASGPTGCGKTTTLYSLLHELKIANRVIITLEDPVEYRIAGITQIQIDMLHDLTFAEGAKAMLRLDPDFLMLGEIRDDTSANTAVNAAISGRVLLSTVHCRDAVGAVSSLRNWNLADHEIAESLSVVVAQRLVRKLCLHCRQRYQPGPAEKAWFKSISLPCPARLWKEKGCAACHHLGYSGRIGIFELWRLEEEDYSLILDHTDEVSIRKNLARRGHEFMLDDAVAKAKAGVTSLDEVKRIGTGIFQTHKSVKPRKAGK